MSALGNLVVALSLEYAAYTKGLDKSDQETLRFAKNTQAAMDKMEKSVGSYINKIVGIGAAYLSVTSVVASINKQVEALAQLDDAAQKTGASVELLSKIQKTAIAFGEDFGGKIEPAITKLSRGIAGLDDPSNKANAALKALGISARDQNGQLRDSAEVTIEVAKALQGYRDDASKTAVAIDLFGKSGAEALPFLNDLAANVDKFSGVSAEAAANAASLQDSINAQKQRFDEFAQQLTIQLLPALNDLAGAFLDVQTKGSELGKDNSFGNWADGFALATASMLDRGAQLKDLFVELSKSAEVIGTRINLTAATFKAANPVEYLYGKNPAAEVEKLQRALTRAQVEESNLYYANSKKTYSEYSDALEARIKNRPNSYASPVVSGSNSQNPSVGYVSGQDAKDAADAKASATAAEAAQKAYDSLTSSIQKQIEVKQADYSVTGSLSEAEKMLIDVNAKRADGQLTLTDTQYKYVQSLIATWEEEIKNSEVAAIRLQAEQDYLKLMEGVQAARDEQYTSLQDETTALEDLAKAKLDEIDQLTMTQEQLNALNVARYEEKIGMLESQKAYLQSQADRENEIELIDRQIEALGILRDSVGKTEAINKSKAETSEMFASMEQAGRLVWTVFANGGDDAAKAVGKSLKAYVYDLLYQLTIKKFFISIEASVTGSVANNAVNSITGQGSGAGGASVFDRITSSLDKANSNITGSIEKLGAFLSNGQGGLADKIGGFMGQYSSQIADGLGYLSSAYQLSQGNIAGAALTAVGTYFGGPIGGAIGSVVGGLFGGSKLPPRYYSGVNTSIDNGKLTNSYPSTGYRQAGANDALESLNASVANTLYTFLDAFGYGDSLTRVGSVLNKKKSSDGAISADIDGITVGSSTGKIKNGTIQQAFDTLTGQALGEFIVKVIDSSKVGDSVKALFDGLTDKTQVSNMISATVSLAESQEALANQYGLTIDEAGKVSVATGQAGDSLAKFVSTLAQTAYSTQKTSEQMIQQRDKLNEQLVESGGNASLSSDLAAFDAFLKNLPKDTEEAQKQFADLFSMRDTVSSVSTAWDQVIASVNSSIYDLLSPAEQASKDAKALTDMFAEFGLQVPKTDADLAALGQSIQQNFNAADEASIDLALAFPTLVNAFTSAKDKIVESAREMNQFTDLAEARFYKGVSYNYGNQLANDYTKVSSMLGTSAAGKTTLKGVELSDLLVELQAMRKASQDTASELQRISTVGLKTQ